jgi:hypothetical protein
MEENRIGFKLVKDKISSSPMLISLVYRIGETITRFILRDHKLFSMREKAKRFFKNKEFVK